MDADESRALCVVVAKLDHGAEAEAAHEQQVGGAREVEVVGTLEGPREGEGGEVEARDDRGDNEAEQLARSIVCLDEEHQRGEEELAADVDDLPEEEARVVVANEEAASSGEGAAALGPHLRADRKQQREESERDEHRPESEHGPKVGVEAAVLVIVGAAEHVEVGHEVAAPLIGKHVDVKRLALLRLEDGAGDRGQHEVGDEDGPVEQPALRRPNKVATHEGPNRECVKGEGGASE